MAVNKINKAQITAMELKEKELKKRNCELRVDKLIEEEKGRLMKEKLKQQIVNGNLKVKPGFGSFF